MDGLIDFKDYFKQIKKNIILNNYYSKKTKDGKTMKASILDWIFVAFILAMFFIITTFNSTKNIIASIILTTILMLIYFIIFISLSNKQRLKNISEINENLGDEEILKQIEKLNNEEYLLYVKELIEIYYNARLFDHDECINFVGEINGENYGIKCFKNSSEDIITEKDIESYNRSMEKKGLEYGIIVTNSFFHEDFKKNLDYLLIDFNYMKKILKKTGKYPSNEEIQDLIISRYKDKRAGLRKDLAINKREKIYKFSLLGIVLFLISSFTSYPLYYKIVGTILIFLGIVLGVNKLIVYLKQNAENRI